MTVVIEHVRHRIPPVGIPMPSLTATLCGRRVLVCFVVPKRDRAAHEPARYRCRSCYA